MNKVQIPLDLSLNGWTLKEVIKSCRADHIISRWLVHHQRNRSKGRPGDQVGLDVITKGFERARKLAGVTGEPGKTPPSFHEIRSLAIRLYTEKYGERFAQAIAGHKNAATTELYRDVCGDEWIVVKTA